MSRALLYPILDWPALSVARTELSSVHPEEPIMRPLSNLIVDFSSPFFSQDCTAMHREDVLYAANATAFGKERKFCLRILAQVNTFVHCSDDVHLENVVDTTDAKALT